MGRAQQRKTDRRIRTINEAMFEGGSVIDMERFTGGKRAPMNAAPRKLPKPRNDNQRRFVEVIENSDISFGVGPAGTGKTFLGVATAVSLFKANPDKYTRLILSRPAVEAGERLGFLPGDLKDKVDPYLRPLYDCLFDFLGPKAVPAMIDQKIIEVCPLAFMRGRTFNNAIVLLDEAQNATKGQLKMALTRLGHSSKMIMTGDPDPSQRDLMEGESGLSPVLECLEGAPGVGVVRFDRADVVRSKIVQTVIDRL
jgi:phosphate starvation-inducible PhoH-like protein